MAILWSHDPQTLPMGKMVSIEDNLDGGFTLKVALNEDFLQGLNLKEEEISNLILVSLYEALLGDNNEHE